MTGRPVLLILLKNCHNKISFDVSLHRIGGLVEGFFALFWGSPSFLLSPGIGRNEVKGFVGIPSSQLRVGFEG